MNEQENFDQNRDLVHTQGKPVDDLSEVEREEQWEYAGFWIRFLALLLDGIILSAFFSMVLLVFGYSPANPDIPIGLDLILRLTGMAYFVVLTTVFGQTLGKMICNIEVVMQKGGSNHFGWILLRESIAKFVSFIILLIGFIMAAFDKRKRTLHDHMAKTYVVKRK